MLTILLLTNYIDLQTQIFIFSLLISLLKEHLVGLFRSKNITRISSGLDHLATLEISRAVLLTAVLMGFS